jgi:hypothetical protein
LRNIRKASGVSPFAICDLREMQRGNGRAARGENMDDNVVGLAAVVLALAFPLAVVWAWAWQRGRKYRAEERLAAIARGLNVPFEPELGPPAASRRAGILLLSAAVGYVATFAMLSRWEPDTMEAAVLGFIPFAIGIGFFIDAYLIRRDLRASH